MAGGSGRKGRKAQARRHTHSDDDENYDGDASDQPQFDHATQATSASTQNTRAGSLAGNTQPSNPPPSNPPPNQSPTSQPPTSRTLGQPKPDNFMMAVHAGEVIGTVYLNRSVDLPHILIPPGSILAVPATLVIGGRIDKLPIGFQHPQEQPRHASRPESATPDTTPQNAGSNRKRLPSNDPPSTSKRRKPAVPSAVPVAPKEASHFQPCIEEPAGMTKEEGESCLTCRNYNRKCRGTDLVMVGNDKRCQVCANKGKKGSDRTCYWKNAALGIVTYKDAQVKLGGRTIEANTRVGRLEKDEKKKQKDTGKGEVMEEEKESDGEEESEESQSPPTREHKTQDEEPSDELMSAAVSAYQSLAHRVTQGLDLNAASLHDATRLMVERQIREEIHRAQWTEAGEALDINRNNGNNDVYESTATGINPAILRIILGWVENNISILERSVHRGEGR